MDFGGFLNLFDHIDKEKDRHREERKDDIEGAHPSKRVKTAEGGAGGDQMEEEKDHAAQKVFRLSKEVFNEHCIVGKGIY